LPAQLIIDQVIGRKDLRDCPTLVLAGLSLPGSGAGRQWGDTRRVEGSIEATRTETLRPGVVQQGRIADLPAEVRAATKPVKGPVQPGCFQVVEFLVHAGVGCRGSVDQLAIEAASQRTDLGRMGSEVTRTERQCQCLRNQLEIE